MADVIVYVHDSSDTNSFSYISNLRVSVASLLHAARLKTSQQQYSLDHIPTLFVATKSDLDLALQVRVLRNRGCQGLPHVKLLATRGAARCILQTFGAASPSSCECENGADC